MPKEHGSWGMVYVPLALGLIVAERWNWPAFWFVVAATTLFLLREPFMVWWRARRRKQSTADLDALVLVHCSVAAVAGALTGRIWLLPMGAVAGLVAIWHSEQTMHGRGRRLGSELVAVFASTLAAPAAYYAATDRLDVTALLVWVVTSAYFAGAVFYVKMRVTAAHAARANVASSARWQCGMYHALLPLVIGAAAMHCNRPLYLMLAFVPVLLRAMIRIARPTRELNLEQIGWSEVVYSLAFLALAAYAI